MMKPQNEIQLHARRVLVTGAARGLGEHLARELVAAGARVAIADVQVERGRALAEGLGANAYFVEINLLDKASIEQGIAQAAILLGGLDGLVNNAAITDSGGVTMDALTTDTWDRVMAVNVRGTWLACQAAWPHLKASGSGRVVNLASDTALWGAPRLLAYVASKGAVMSMTRSLAREMGVDDITVNAVAPGLVVGESTEYVPPQRHQHYLDGRAIKRPQLPQDVSALTMFLLTHASGFVTGQVLPVNGGFVMN
jgi:NAD(P)-dependent dehydrogenase (short-subunit alcohol dehydrogenase family)